MKKKHLIIYHREDNDGVFSAALIYDWLIRQGAEPRDIVCQGHTYPSLDQASGSSEKDVKHWAYDLARTYNDVTIADISFDTPDKMKTLLALLGPKLLWFDHHAPVIRTSYKSGFDGVTGERDTSVCTILNVWRFLYDFCGLARTEYERKKAPWRPGMPVRDEKYPELFAWLSGWDSWTYARYGLTNEDVRRVNAGITYHTRLDVKAAYGIVKEIVDGLKEGHMRSARYVDLGMELGNRLCMEQDAAWAEEMKSREDWTLDGRKAAMVVHPGVTSSVMFRSLDPAEYAHGICLKPDPDGTCTVSCYNLRDGDTFDLGEYLKRKYCGGGHTGAAGCTVTAETYARMLREKAV